MDELADTHGLYKVETIGDAWFGVTNCVTPQPRDHAKRIAEFALQSMQAANETLIDLDNPDRGYVQIRIGLNRYVLAQGFALLLVDDDSHFPLYYAKYSGPVLTNVIGTRNPHFTLFGDAVNTAARMESNSLPGRIQCSEATATLLRQQAPHVDVKCRGTIPIKGKGEMTTYWVGGAFEPMSVDKTQPTRQNKQPGKPRQHKVVTQKAPALPATEVEC